MVDTYNTFSSLSTDAPNVAITRRMFTLAERNLAIGQFAMEYSLENYMGKTMRINRYRRFNLPTQTLVEGVPPDAVGLVVDNVDVTVEQWGIVALLTDVAQLTLSHPVLNVAMERCSLAISEVVERELAKVLMTCTNVVYPTGATSRDTISDGVANPNQRLSTDIVLQCVVQLRGRGAPSYEGGLYGGIMQPQHEGDMNNSDTTFQQSSNFARVRKLEYAEIGIWQGVHWVRGNFLPFFVGVAAPDGSAASATKALVTISDSGGSLTRSGTGVFKIKVVAREVTSDYERRISQNSGNLTLSASVTTGSITVGTPTSSNYVYDIYMTQEAGSTYYLARSRVAASTTVVITSSPAGTEATAPVAPASSVSVFPGWVVGKDAFARVKLNGMSMQSYITPAGASFSNPLAQARKVGTKFMFKPAIQDNNYIVRFEVSSRFGNYLAA